MFHPWGLKKYIIFEGACQNYFLADMPMGKGVMVNHLPVFGLSSIIMTREKACMKRPGFFKETVYGES
jgi:hypothetical protein